MRKTKKLIAALGAVFALAVSSLGMIPNADKQKTAYAAEEFTRTSMEVAKDMGRGINLGNTMDCTTQWVSNPTMKDYETGWGAPLTTKEMVDGMKTAGFDTLRIPISWMNGMYFSKISSNYSSSLDYMKLFTEEKDAKIKDEYFDRIDEIISYALDNDMYVIINDHYDYGWWDAFKSTDTYDAAMYHYKSMWEQIASHYKDYSEKLIFESANEELSAAYDSWENPNDFMGYDTVNEINQTFVDLVRKSGGNNSKRYLLIAGVNTNIAKTCDDRFKMPKDTIENHLMVSVHFYDPYPYCDMWQDADWAKVQTSWGTDAEKNTMKTTLDKMTKFTENGYGVVIGEYGVLPKENGGKYERKDNDTEWFKYFLEICDTNGYVPVLWDQCGMYNRVAAEMRFADIAALFIKEEPTASEGSTLAKPALPKLANTASGISVKWTKIKDATGYKIYRKEGKTGKFVQIKIINSGSTLSYTDTTVQAGKSYYYTIRATKGSEYSAYNTNGAAVVRLANQRVKTLVNTKAGIQITWSKASGAKGYNIYKKTGNGSYKLYKKITSKTTIKFTDKKVSNGKTYAYKIVAVNGSANSTATAMKIVRLSTPTIKSAKNTKTKSIAVKWSKNKKASGYQVKYKTGKTTKTKKFAKASSVKKVLNKLTKGKTYSIYVRSYKKVNGKTYYSGWSKVKKCKVVK